jgi:hypothetical protein
MCTTAQVVVTSIKLNKNFDNLTSLLALYAPIRVKGVNTCIQDFVNLTFPSF